MPCLPLIKSLNMIIIFYQIYKSVIYIHLFEITFKPVYVQMFACSYELECVYVLVHLSVCVCSYVFECVCSCAFECVCVFLCV